MSEVASICTQARAELQRAERYRIFVSLICIDFSFISSTFGADSPEIFAKLEQKAKDIVRVCDFVSVLPDGCMALLYPETNRDGAEVGARRITELLRDSLIEFGGEALPEVIPLEIASYPDAAGARSIDDLVTSMSGNLNN